MLVALAAPRWQGEAPAVLAASTGVAQPENVGTEPGHDGDERARSEQREVNAEVEYAQREEQGRFKQQQDAETAPDFTPQDRATPARERLQQAIHISREITEKSKRLCSEAQASVDRAKEMRNRINPTFRSVQGSGTCGAHLGHITSEDDDC